MHLQEPFLHLCRVVRESQLVHLVAPYLAQTTFAQQRAYLVETNLPFKVVRVNHGAKVVQSE